MNVDSKIMEEGQYPFRLNMMEGYVDNIFGSKTHVLYVNNTVQFSYYSKYVCTMFDPEGKAKYREEHFPKDCKKARELGAALVREQ